jgi:hypothetical protein
MYHEFDMTEIFFTVHFSMQLNTVNANGTGVGVGVAKP